MASDDNIEKIEELFNHNYEALRDQICQILKDRYNRQFTVSGVNMSYGTFTVILTLHPEDEPELLFSVRIDDGNIIHEDYLEKRCLQEMEKQIRTTVPGIYAKACFIDSDGIDESDTEIMLIKYIKKHRIQQIMVRLIFCEKNCPDRDTLTALFENLSALYNVDLIMRCWTHSQEGFEKCGELLTRIPSINETIIKRCAPISLVSFSSQNGVTRRTEDYGYAIH